MCLQSCDSFVSALQQLILKIPQGFQFLPNLPLPLSTPPFITCHTLLPRPPHLLHNSQWPNFPPNPLLLKIPPLKLLQTMYMDCMVTSHKGHMIKVTSHTGHMTKVTTQKQIQKWPDLKGSWIHGALN